MSKFSSFFDTSFGDVDGIDISAITTCSSSAVCHWPAKSGESISITFSVTGSPRIIRADQIMHCQGAGGYVELHLVEGRTLLHTATLNELAESLPLTFLRVHRSYLVNTTHVRALRRSASGPGRLLLSDGTEVPVSRRVMPKIRLAIDSGTSGDCRDASRSSPAPAQSRSSPE